MVSISLLEAFFQAMVHECLTYGGIDPLDIGTVMSAFKAKSLKPTIDSPRKI